MDEAGAWGGADAVLRALADPNRRHILSLVRRRELSAGQIAVHFDVTPQAVSQHLRVLKDAGLPSERRDGTKRMYALRSEGLEPVRSVLNDLWPDALARLKRVVEQARNQDESGNSMVKSEPVRATIRIAAAPADIFPCLVDTSLIVE